MLKRDIYNKTGMITGVLGAVLTFLALYIAFNLSEHPFERFGFFSIAIPIVLIFAVPMCFRAMQQDISLSFFEILKMSWWNLLITSLLFSTFYAFYIMVEEVEFMKKYITFYEFFIRSSEVYKADPQASEDQLKISLENAKNMSIFKFIIDDLKNKILVGSFASLIVSVILRK